jgi:hypothetical protein
MRCLAFLPGWLPVLRLGLSLAPPLLFARHLSLLGSRGFFDLENFEGGGSEQAGAWNLQSSCGVISAMLPAGRRHCGLGKALAW